MYVQNVSNFNQQFKASGHSFTLKPGQTVSLTADEYHDHTVQFLLARGILKVLGEEEGLENVVQQADEAQAKADENKMEVVSASANTTNQVIMVQCAAQKKNGERCLVNAKVDVADYDENTPYFCTHHRNEKAEDYERVDGTWVKKAVASELNVEPEQVEEPEVEIDPISEEDIADAIAEAMSEASE